MGIIKKLTTLHLQKTILELSKKDSKTFKFVWEVFYKKSHEKLFGKCRPDSEYFFMGIKIVFDKKVTQFVKR